MHSFLSPDPITVEVRNTAGAITIDLTDTTMTTVELIATDDNPGGFLDDVIRSVAGWGPRTEPVPATTDEAAEDVFVEFAATKLVVDTEPARRQWHRGFLVRITAPTGSGVRIRTETAPVQVNGEPDRIEVKSATGPIEIDSSAGNAVLRTVSGDIEIRDARGGTIDLASVSGSMTVGIHEGVGARVDLTTVSGRAESGLPVTDQLDGTTLTVKGRTVSGHIALRTASLTTV